MAILKIIMDTTQKPGGREGLTAENPLVALASEEVLQEAGVSAPEVMETNRLPIREVEVVIPEVIPAKGILQPALSRKQIQSFSILMMEEGIQSPSPGMLL